MGASIKHHALTYNYNARVNKIITQDIMIDKPNKREYSYKYNALWDTGATNCAITENVVKALNLKHIDVVKVKYGRSEEYSNIYCIDILLPNRVVIQSLDVTLMNIIQAGDISVDVIIGMDIISLGDFAITNRNEKTTMSFIIPSYKKIDFVPISEKMNVENCDNRKQRRDTQFNRGKK